MTEQNHRDFDKIFKDFKEVVFNIDSGATLLKYGSVVSGLANRDKSDLDMTVIAQGHDEETLIKEIKKKLIEKHGEDRFIING